MGRDRGGALGQRCLCRLNGRQDLRLVEHHLLIRGCTQGMVLGTLPPNTWALSHRISSSNSTTSQASATSLTLQPSVLFLEG